MSKQVYFVELMAREIVAARLRLGNGGAIHAFACTCVIPHGKSEHE